MRKLGLLFSIFCGYVWTVNGGAEVSLQLLTYVNPTFGLADKYFYCAYQSQVTPPQQPPANLRSQQNGYDPNQQQQQQQQYQQNQPNQRNQRNQQQYVPYGQQNAQQQQQQQHGQYQPNPQYGVPNSQSQQVNQYQQYQQNQQNLQNQNQNPAYQQYQQQYQQQHQQQQRDLTQQRQQFQQRQYMPYQVQQCMQQPTDFPKPNWNECKLHFATVFSTMAGEPVIVATGLIPLPSENATIKFNETTWNDKCNFGNCADQTWNNPQKFTFLVKPNLIEVLVTQFGDAAYGSNQMGYISMGTDQARIVDSIPIHIADLTPAGSGVNPAPWYSICLNGENKTVTNYPLSTLNLVISVRCTDGTFGKFCNLTNCTTYDNNTQICSSSLYRGQQLVCNYDPTTMQPVNCTMCPYGISAGQCRTSTPTVQSADVTGYIVGIAILAILLAIAIVIIIIGFFTYRNKNKNHPNEKDLRDQRRSQPTSSSAGWLGTKSAPKTNGNNNGAAAPTRGAYTPAPQDEPVDSEWQQQRSPPAVTLQQGPPLRPYNFPPPPARQPPSNASTPEHNGSRREAAV